MARLLDGYYYVYFRFYAHWSGDKELVYDAPSSLFLNKFEAVMNNNEFSHFSCLKHAILHSKFVILLN